MYHLPLYQAQAAITKHHGLGSLNNRTLFFLQFWRPVVWDQGVGRFGSSWGLNPWLRDGHLLSVSSHGCPSMGVCVLVSSYKDISHTGLGLPYWPHVNLITTLNTPISKFGPILRWGGVGTSTYEFGGHNSAHSIFLGLLWAEKWKWKYLSRPVVQNCLHKCWSLPYHM